MAIGAAAATPLLGRPLLHSNTTATKAVEDAVVLPLLLPPVGEAVVVGGVHPVLNLVGH